VSRQSDITLTTLVLGPKELGKPDYPFPSIFHNAHASQRQQHTAERCKITTIYIYKSFRTNFQRHIKDLTQTNRNMIFVSAPCISII
jgi:hypothetical protein